MFLSAHLNNMFAFRERARSNIIAKLFECFDALNLQPIVLSSKITIHFSMTRHMSTIFAQNVFSKKILRVASRTSPHGPEKQIKTRADR